LKLKGEKKPPYMENTSGKNGEKKVPEGKTKKLKRPELGEDNQTGTQPRPTGLIGGGIGQPCSTLCI